MQIPKYICRYKSHIANLLFHTIYNIFMHYKNQYEKNKDSRFSEI